MRGLSRRRRHDHIGRIVVGETGFEPATSCSQSRRATGLRYSPTTDPRLRQGGDTSLSRPNALRRKRQAKKKAAFPKGDRPFLVSVNAPKGCDLLLFFSHCVGRSSSGVSRSSSGSSSVSRSSSFCTSSSSVGTSGSGFSASSSGVGAFFSNRFSGRSFGGGFFSSLFTASGEGEHAGSNGDSSKLLHDVWAP